MKVMYNGLLYESVDNTTLDSLRDSLVSKHGVEVSLQKTGDGGIAISKIVVPKENRNAGVGTKAMNDIIAFANSTRSKIYLNPAEKSDGWGTTSKSRLIDYYKRLGFVENAGRNRDYSTSYRMYKNPS